jgi:hypothetical protein
MLFPYKLFYVINLPILKYSKYYKFIGTNELEVQ